MKQDFKLFNEKICIITIFQIKHKFAPICLFDKNRDFYV